MALDAKKIYALSKSYTDESVEGAGAIKGKNCQIQAIDDIEGGHRITFAWYNEDDIIKTDTLDVMNGERGEKGDPGEKGEPGEQGVGIADIRKTSSVGLVDTYIITMTDGETYFFTVTNGSSNVVANPEGEATDDLTKVSIDGTIYNVKGGNITVDDAMSSTSKNPVQNKVITSALGDKADISSLPSMGGDGYLEL